MESNTPKCPNHPEKDSAFYCFKHSTFACLKCVAVHIQCQVEDQFHPLEEVFDTLQSDVTNDLSASSQHLKGFANYVQDSNNKLTTLDSYRKQDLEAIQSFFEEMKRKSDELKQKALENYEACFLSIVEKIQINNNIATDSLEKEQDHFTKLQKLQDNLAGASKADEKKLKSVELWREREKIVAEAEKHGKYNVLDHELEFLMSKEEIFSEIGNITLLYNNITPKVVDYIGEHMREYLRDQDGQKTGSGDAKREKKEGEGSEGENKEMATLDDRISRIDYLKDDKQIFEGNFTRLLEAPEEEFKSAEILHQLRYCSNEVNVFDTTTGKFSCYELFTTAAFKTPFLIFNNCCSALYRNHLIFLFGGEDPALNDKSSNRVFCLNIQQASAEKKVVVYEIDSMAFPRQEFTVATVGNSIYVVSGYDSNKAKEYRVIPKCERLDIKSRKFYEMRDINYPRQAACSTNVNNTHVYVFAGQNPKYLNHFVDKIERYVLNLNDWAVVKYSVMNEFTYEPGTNATAFRLNETDLVVLGGTRDLDVLNGYYIFDMRKLLFVKKGEGFLEEADNFFNQNDVQTGRDGIARVFSSNLANCVYEIRAGQEPYVLEVRIKDASEQVEDEGKGKGGEAVSEKDEERKVDRQ